jgi:hypothetical protein
MERRAIILVDLDGSLDRHRFGGEPMLRGPIPALEPPARWRADRWTELARIIDRHVAAALLPYHREGALVLMTRRPAALHARLERRLTAAGFSGVPLHHVAAGEHPAYGKRRIARAVRLVLTIEDDLRVAEFLAKYGYETLLLDDRYNRGPIRSVNLMRIARADLAKVLALRLGPDLADDAELELAPVIASA